MKDMPTKLLLNRTRIQPCLSGLLNVMGTRLGLRFAEDALFDQLNKHKEKTERLVNYLEGLSGPIKRTASIRLYELAWNLLIDSCRDHGQEPTVPNLLSHITQLPAKFDEGFPGYLEGGLFPLVVHALGG
jgi:hypothetical protein